MTFWAQDCTHENRRHSPEQIIRKLAEEDDDPVWTGPMGGLGQEP
jgi:hypothetical protein